MRLNAITLTCILLFIGAVGKSAQIGLHTWLPNAMESPMFPKIGMCCRQYSLIKGKRTSSLEPPNIKNINVCDIYLTPPFQFQKCLIDGHRSPPPTARYIVLFLPYLGNYFKFAYLPIKKVSSHNFPHG
jgi:Proton-conducting membrane transporter